MALPASDNFNGSDGAALQSYNPLWTVLCGGFALAGAALRPTGAGAESAAVWNAESWPPDHYSQATLSSSSSAGAMGVAVRAGALDYYGFYANNAGSVVFRVQNGAWSDLSGSLGGVSAGSVLRLEARGSTLTAKRDGVTVWSGTDASLSGGAAGLCGWDSASTTRLDNWSGGSLLIGYTLTAGPLLLPAALLEGAALAQAHALAAGAFAAEPGLVGSAGLAQAHALASQPLLLPAALLPQPALAAPTAAANLLACPALLAAPGIVQQHAFTGLALSALPALLALAHSPHRADPGRVLTLAGEWRGLPQSGENRRISLEQEQRIDGISE